jgi:hypothetical protein
MSSQTSLPLWRRLTARTLVVIGVLLIAVTIVASYVRWQAFDNGTFRNTSRELIADDAVRNEIGATLVEQLFTNVDVEQLLDERLPAEQQRLAGPLAAGLRGLADRLAVEMLDRPRVQALWQESVGLAHEQLVDLLRGDTSVVQVRDKSVVLDLQPLVLRLGERLSLLQGVADRLPPDTGVITIMESDQLQRAQDVTSLFETVATWIWVVPLVLFAIAIWLVPGRRRLELRAVAFGLILAGLLVLALRSLAGGYVVDALSTTTSTREAGDHAWRILTDLLADGGWAAISIGLVALLGVWLAGNTKSGRSARSWLAPVFARPGLTYVILGVLYLLFIWWGPYAQARRPLYLIVIGVLLVVGVEALRRMTVREFPDAIETQPRELFSPLGRLRPASHAAPAAAAPSRIDQLERLATLREQGVLSEEELAAEKARLG